MGIFRDFIPEGEETGAIGSGFKDFVPTPETQAVPVEEVSEPEVVETPAPKGKQKKG